MPELFLNNSFVMFWKVNLEIIINQEKASATSIVFKINKPPRDGKCVTNLLNGTSMETYFTIYCKNWIDEDGIIVKYEYYGNQY